MIDVAVELKLDRHKVDRSISFKASK